jgi:hypothetical protein
MKQSRSSMLKEWFRLGIAVAVLLSMECVRAADVQISVIDPVTDQMILSDYVPDLAKPSYLARAVAGEYVSVGVVVRSDTVIPRFLLRPGLAQGGSEGEGLEKAVDIRIVRPWYQAAGAWESQKRKIKAHPVLVPELLVRDWNLVRVNDSEKKNYLRAGSGSRARYVDVAAGTLSREPVIHGNEVLPVVDAPVLQTVDLLAGHAIQYWVTIDIPADAIPGLRTLRLDAICSETNLCGHVEIGIEVLPFRLRNSDMEYSIYYRGKLFSGGGTVSSEYKNEQQLTAEFLDMRRHGVTNPTVYQRFHPKGVMEPESGADARRLLARYLKLRRDAGFHSEDLYYLGRVTGAPKDRENVATLTDDVRQIRRLADQYGYSQVFFYGIDEASGAELTGQRIAWQAVRSAGGKVFAAGNADAIEAVAGLLDILVVLGVPDASYVARAADASADLWLYSYGNPQTGPENPVPFRVNYGIRLWQAGFHGAMVYAYQHSMGSIWDDSDHSVYRDHAFTYPVVNGVIGTVAWEGFREGVMDVRYLQTLHYQLMSCGNQEAKHTGLRFLSSLRMLKVVDPQRIRNDVIDLIISLQVDCRPPQKEAH